MRWSAIALTGLVSWMVLASGGSPTQADETLQQRRVRLESMSDAEKTRLAEKKRRFDELPKDEQQKYRTLHDQLVQDPDYQRLRGILQRYSDWLRTLTPNQRAELSQLSSDERLARVKQLMDAQATERFRLMLREAKSVVDILSPEDLDVIFKWTDQFLIDHANEILETVPGPNPLVEQMQESLDRDKHIHFLRFWYFRPDSRATVDPPPDMGDSRAAAGGGESRPPMPPGPGGPPLTGPQVEDLAQRLPRPSPEEEADLVARVSPRAQEALKKATQEGQRSQIIHNWMRAATFSRFRPPVRPEDLDRFVLTLTADERERLESMPRDRMYDEIRKLYFRTRFQGRWGEHRSEGGGFGSGAREGDPRGGSFNGGGRGPRGSQDRQNRGRAGRERGESQPKGPPDRQPDGRGTGGQGSDASPRGGTAASADGPDRRW